MNLNDIGGPKTATSAGGPGAGGFNLLGTGSGSSQQPKKDAFQNLTSGLF